MDHMESVVLSVRLLWFVSSLNRVFVHHTNNQYSGMHSWLKCFYLRGHLVDTEYFCLLSSWCLI